MNFPQHYYTFCKLQDDFLPFPIKLQWAFPENSGLKSFLKALKCLVLVLQYTLTVVRISRKGCSAEERCWPCQIYTQLTQLNYLVCYVWILIL